MKEQSTPEDLLRELPSVDELMKDPALSPGTPGISRAFVVDCVREAIEEARGAVLSGSSAGDVSRDALVAGVRARVERLMAPSLRKVVNASGTVLHTNIGRAELSLEAAEAAREAAGACNIEYDLAAGKRGERDSHVEDLLTRLTGAEAACVVNNNAAAVLLTLNTLALGREVVVSRGELIEIGGSFRLPDIIEKSGCVMREVGTTNRTHPGDYSGAVGPDTALLFKAHTSNYRVVGFTREVPFKELVETGREHGLPVVEDLGSGTLVDLTRYGLPPEPVVSDVVRAGADVVTFSGDKLLGGPQAGLVVGRKDLVERIRKNPMKRALRAGKFTLASLEATLRLYLDPERLPERLPALKYLTRTIGEIDAVAGEAAGLIKDALGGEFTVEVEDGESVAGGGSLPGETLPTRVVAVTHPLISSGRIFSAFLSSDPPVLGRVSGERFILDMRTVENARDVVPGDKVF